MNARLNRALASGLGSGYCPRAPGTAGTLVAVPLAWAGSHLAAVPQLLLLLLSLPLAAAVCDQAERADGHTDPGWIVCDEIIGFWVAVYLLPPTLSAYIAAFVLFRLFDILKPPPVGWVDRTLPGGWGILMDDVVAGIYARCLLGVGQWLGLL